MESEDGAPKELGISGYLYFVADAEFNRLLEKYNLKEADYYDRDNPLGIALDRNIEFDRRLEKFVTLDTLKGDGCVIEGLYYVEIDGYYRKDSRIDENGNKVVLYQTETTRATSLSYPMRNPLQNTRCGPKKPLRKLRSLSAAARRWPSI